VVDVVDDHRRLDGLRGLRRRAEEGAAKLREFGADAPHLRALA
jgi:hypothetical protein